MIARHSAQATTTHVLFRRRELHAVRCARSNGRRIHRTKCSEFALLLAYSVPTVRSFLVSSRTMVRTIGLTLFVSLVLAILIKREALTSVWCFFAAVLSGMIYVAVTRMRRAAGGARAIAT